MDKPGRKNRSLRALALCLAALAAAHVFPAGAEASDAVGGILISIFLGKWGLKILYGESITSYSYLLVPMVIVSVLTALTILLGNLSIVLRDRLGANLSGGIGLAAVIISSVFLVKSMGMQGANLSLIIGLLVQDLVLILGIIRKIKKEGYQS